MLDVLSWLYTEKSMRKWADTRAKGRRRFVWRVGVCYWGGLMCATMLAFEMSLPDTTFSLVALLRDLAIWAVVGYAWGVGTWSLNEKLFARFGAR